MEKALEFCLYIYSYLYLLLGLYNGESFVLSEITCGKSERGKMLGFLV